MKATCSPSGDTRGVSYARPGAFSGSAFPCRSTQTSVRSSKSERPATYANSPLPDNVYCAPSPPGQDSLGNGDRRGGSDLKACQIECHGHQRPGRALDVDEMTRRDVVACFSLRQHAPFTARHTLHLHLPLISPGPGARRKQDRLSSWQDLWPSMTDLPLPAAS